MKQQGEIDDESELATISEFEKRLAETATTEGDKSRATYMRYYRAATKRIKLKDELGKTLANKTGALYDLWLECKESSVIVFSSKHSRLPGPISQGSARPTDICKWTRCIVGADFAFPGGFRRGELWSASWGEGVVGPLRGRWVHS